MGTFLFYENAPMPDAPLKQTSLHALHVRLGARMVPFAGCDMPVQYPLGVMKEHLHTREHAGLFDVSHMGQVELHGPDAAAALESLCPQDFVGLAPGKQRYGFFTNEAGGILDDLMVFNTGGYLHVVVNAACKDADIAHMRKHIGKRCEIRVRDDLALVALQGPKAVAVLAKNSSPFKGEVGRGMGFAQVAARTHPHPNPPLEGEGIEKLTFMTGGNFTLFGIPCQITRSGYTGEDGCELSIPAAQIEHFCEQLLKNPDVQMIGLGARDSLRLEAGLCLYGHDIETTTTPTEANLNWAMQKIRKPGGARAGGYPGATFIEDHITNGAPRSRVGIAPQTKAPVREAATLHDASGKQVGIVTSGGFGPTANAPVAMGYVNAQHCAAGTELNAMVRDKPVPVKVVTMPFAPHRYFRGA
jgi:aminomethyltransferase